MKIPQKPTPINLLLGEIQEKGDFVKVLRLLEGDINSKNHKYYHWDKLRHLKPPESITHKEWWAAIKLSRNSSRRKISLKDKSGENFYYNLPDEILAALHKIDKNASGIIEMPEPIANTETRDRYIQSSLIEEAITSSQLEGAATTREVAKEMIRSGRTPINEGEKMILNNYFAMKNVSQIKGEEITTELIVSLHRILVKNIMDLDRGPYREKGDGIKVYDNEDNKVLHDPPEADEIPMRLKKFCHFASGKDDNEFIHPVIRAIIIHFWMAYDHPFKDGNGRTARALFYWSMMKQGFWLFEFISISNILKKAPTKYAKSFLYTETDDNDLTYFIIYQLEVICRAIDNLHEYIRRKTDEYRELSNLLKPSLNLNHRQIAVLSNALKHPNQNYTIQSHQKSHNVTYQTARTDLLTLNEKGFLRKSKHSKAFVFRPVINISQKIRDL